MDIRTMTDSEEIRLQRALDEAALRIDEWQRGRRDGPVVKSVGPMEEPPKWVITGDLGEMKSGDELYADHATSLANIRAYRQLKEARNA